MRVMAGLVPAIHVLTSENDRARTPHSAYSPPRSRERETRAFVRWVQKMRVLSACRTSGAFELRGKFFQLIAIEVADRQKIQALIGPASDVESLHALQPGRCHRRANALGNEQIDYVHPAPVNDRRHRLAVDEIESAADQGKALRGEVGHRRGEGDADRGAQAYPGA